MPPEPPQYRAYLLRCWEECEEVAGTRLWRFSLENARSGQRRGFASLSELAAALAGELTPNQPREPSEETPQKRPQREEKPCSE